MKISDITQVSSFFRVLLNRLPLSHVQETELQSSPYFYVCPEDHQESHPLVSQVRLELVSVMSLLVQCSLLSQMHPHTSEIMAQQRNARGYSVKLLSLGTMFHEEFLFGICCGIPNDQTRLMYNAVSHQHFLKQYMCVPICFILGWQGKNISYAAMISVQVAINEAGQGKPVSILSSG